MSRPSIWKSGPGEFLGARQSGHIAARGFRTVCGNAGKGGSPAAGLTAAPEELNRSAHQPLYQVRRSFPKTMCPTPDNGWGLQPPFRGFHPGRSSRVVGKPRTDSGPPNRPATCSGWRNCVWRLLSGGRGGGMVRRCRGGTDRPKVDADRIVDLLQKDPDFRYSPTGMLRLKVSDPRADRISAASLALRRLGP